MTTEKKHIVDILFVLALFGVFALSAFAVVILGADVYKQTIAHMTDNYNARVAYSYFTEKFRQNDTIQSVTIDDFYGTDALAFRQEIDGDIYVTYLYYHEGYVKELFMRSGSNIGDSPFAAGNPILPLENLQMSFLSDNLIRITFTQTGDDAQQVYISAHCN